MLWTRPVSGPIRVGVLVDLKLKSTAGGHVKCWQHFAEAAMRWPQEIDLTIHFAGDEDEERPLSDNVRYRILRRALSTALLPLPVKQPDHTDMAPVHWRLQRCFDDYDVLHATDAWFAYARTAMRYHQQTGKPLVSSTHTDVPNYTRVVTRKVVRRLFGRGIIGERLIDRWHVPRHVGDYMQHKLDHYLAESDHVLASSDDDYRRAVGLLPEGCVTRLRRGIDKDLFHPRHRNRALLAERYGIPPDAFLLLFVGRMDEAKRPAVLARAAQQLLSQGLPVHVAFVGRGPLRGALKKDLGPAATVIDPLPHEQLRDVYAGADLFVFPSATEVMPNVVIEAKASGLPVVLADRGGSRQLVQVPGEDGVLVRNGNPARWASAIARAFRHPDWRASLARAARHHIETGWPSWDDVLQQDLLPAWERVVRHARERAAVPVA